MIRILRLIEYTYPDNQMAERDMGNWNFPGFGTKNFGLGTVLRSTIITDLNYEPEVIDESNDGHDH